MVTLRNCDIFDCVGACVGMCPKSLCHLRHLAMCRDLGTLRNVSAICMHIATYWVASRIAHFADCVQNPFVNCDMFGCVENGHFAESVQNRFANWDILGCVENWWHFAECVRYQFASCDIFCRVGNWTLCEMRPKFLVVPRVGYYAENVHTIFANWPIATFWAVSRIGHFAECVQTRSADCDFLVLGRELDTLWNVPQTLLPIATCLVVSGTLCGMSPKSICALRFCWCVENVGTLRNVSDIDLHIAAFWEAS